MISVNDQCGVQAGTHVLCIVPVELHVVKENNAAQSRRMEMFRDVLELDRLVPFPVLQAK